MRKIASLGILIGLSAASAAVASETEAPFARVPSEMTGEEIDAYNMGRAANAPDYIRCRRIEQIGRAGRTHDAALRKGHDLHRHPVAVRIAHGQHLFEMGEADAGIDIDMAAHLRRAV